MRDDDTKARQGHSSRGGLMRCCNGPSAQRKHMRAAAPHHEDVARVGTLAASAEELKQVMELPVNVTTDGDRALHSLHSALLEHQLLHKLAEMLQVTLGQQLALLDALDPLVEIAPHRL